MPAAILDDPILKRFRKALDELYGDRIEYGSRARGGAREDSDYDVAVFLHDLGNRRDEVRRMVPVGTARRSRSKPDIGVVTSLVELLNQDGDVVLSLKPVSLMRCRPAAEGGG